MKQVKVYINNLTLPALSQMPELTQKDQKWKPEGHIPAAFLSL